MTNISNPGIIGGIIFLGTVFSSVFAMAEPVPGQLSIIELFTSQGCSSCPAADRLLQEIAKKPGVIALSFPVTYWDYLGWKDTLARPENTERQRGYAAFRGDGQVYTPQAVVNGMEGCVGSNRTAIEAAFETTAPIVRKEAVSLTVNRDDSKLVIETGAAPAGSKHKAAKLWVATVQRSLTVPIERGENAGRSVTYTNVVRHLTSAGEWHGAPTSYALPLQTISREGDMIVVFLQAEGLGPILAAARISRS